MSSEQDFPIGTKLWNKNDERVHDYDWIVVGHKSDGDLLVNDLENRHPSGIPFCGSAATQGFLSRLGWTWKLPRPKISNKGFAKFVRQIESRT